MVPLNWPLRAPSPQDMRWLRVEDASAVAACRNAVLTMAGRLEFPAARADQLALAVTEAASNLYKHARQGCLLLAVNRDAEEPGIELVTVDSGPGLPDVSAALRDGHSTAGTLGIGLGAIRRLADYCDLYSVPGHGTSLAARFWPAPRPPRPAGPAWSGPSPARSNAATSTGRSRRATSGRPSFVTGSVTVRWPPRPPRPEWPPSSMSPHASRPRCSSELTSG